MKRGDHASFPLFHKQGVVLQELLERAEAAQIFEHIPLVAVGKMRGVDWAVITVSLACFC